MTAWNLGLLLILVKVSKSYRVLIWFVSIAFVIMEFSRTLSRKRLLTKWKVKSLCTR